MSDGGAEQRAGCADSAGLTLAICGSPQGCKHDFFGPGSMERAFEDGNGSERVCAKCGLGAMAFTLSMDF